MPATPAIPSAHIRGGIPLFRSQGVEAVDAPPPGRFLRNAGKLWRQRYFLPPDFPLFAGHFPGRPVLPALGHVLLARDAAECLAGASLSIESVGQAKFLSPVEPGTLLSVLMAQPEEQPEKPCVWRFAAFCVRNAETVEAARMTMTLRASV